MAEIKTNRKVEFGMISIIPRCDIHQVVLTLCISVGNML